MRVLYNQSAVSGEHNCADKFLNLRDETRQNAQNYVNSLLPKSDNVVREIRAYLYGIKACEFEDWAESLQEMREEVLEAVRASNLLMEGHAHMMNALKKNENDADSGIQEIDMLKEIYEADAEESLAAASDHLNRKKMYQWLGFFLWLPTFGIGTRFAQTRADQEQQKIEECLLKAGASKRNLEVIVEAVNLTKKYLIPSIKIFLAGHVACNAFLKTTKEQLTRLSNNGQADQNEALRRYFQTMKMHVEELDNDCLGVITSSSHFRTDLESIQSEPGDQNYVDKWHAEQLAKLETQQIGSVFGPLLKTLRQGWKHCFCGFSLLLFSVLSYRNQSQSVDSLVHDTPPNYGGAADFIVKDTIDGLKDEQN